MIKHDWNKHFFYIYPFYKILFINPNLVNPFSFNQKNTEIIVKYPWNCTYNGNKWVV